MKGEFYKMEYDAWDEGTFDLSLEEEAAYLRLCHQMYRRRAPIPNSTRMLCALFRCHHVKALALVKKLVAAGKIGLTPEGFLTNNRVATELQERDKVRASRQEAGHKGGTRSAQARSNPLKNHESHEAIASTSAKQNEAEKRREEKNTPVVPKGTAERFEEFRSAYPKRNTAFPTTAARRRWDEAIRKGASPDEIIAGAKAYGREQARIGRVGTEYVKTADVWLNQGRWRDFLEQPVAPAAGQAAGPDPYLASLSDDRWRAEVQRWRDRVGHWPLRARTPPPDDPRTLVPRHILAELNIHPAQARAA